MLRGRSMRWSRRRNNAAVSRSFRTVTLAPEELEMTTASDRVAVIATQVAQTDRRALSEAWYSALHLARDAAPLPRPAARNALVTQPSALKPQAAHSPAGAGRLVPRPAARPVRGAEAHNAVPDERRRPASETDRRIQRAVATLSARRPVPAAHTVDIAGGRVRLLVHHDGRQTRIVALCSGPLREQVERALASARFTLAATGATVGAP
jgi:hypothetical protein